MLAIGLIKKYFKMTKVNAQKWKFKLQSLKSQYRG